MLMHNTKILFFLVLTHCHLVFSATQPGQVPQAPPLPPGAYPVYIPIPTQPSNVNVYGNGQATATNSNSTQQHNQQHIQQQQHTNTTVHHEVSHKVHHDVEHKIVLPSMPSPDFTSATNSIQKAITTVRSWLISHKWYIASGIIAGIYCNIYYQLTSIKNILEQHGAWCLWKQAIPLSHLATTTKEDLLQQLQFDMHKKYYRTLPHINQQTLHTLFFQDIEKEQKMLQTYTNIYTFCKTTHSTRIFPFSLQPQEIEQRQARLEFVIDLFLTWYAHQEQ